MVNRVLLNFGFSLVQSGMLYLITADDFWRIQASIYSRSINLSAPL